MVFPFPALPLSQRRGREHFDFPILCEMVAITIANITTCIGLLLVCHSAYSCLHYRSLELVVDRGGGSTISSRGMNGTSAPPMDVILEVFVGFLLCLCGQLVSIGPLVEINKSSSTTKPIVAPMYKSRVFDIYNTRRHGGEKKITKK